MTTAHTLSTLKTTRIALIGGWHDNPFDAVKFGAESGDVWHGTLDEFWENNQTYTWGDMRDILDTLRLHSTYHLGGGAQPCFTIVEGA